MSEIKGDNNKRMDIPYIEILCGKYSGENILEGFIVNTEILSNGNSENATQFDRSFNNMCAQDDEIIFQITGQ